MPVPEGATVPPLGAGATNVSLEQNFLRVLVEPGPKDTEVDIVAVHGLNPTNGSNHAENTWTKGQTLWLKDLLPQKLKSARVMLFGYNANVAFQSSTAGVLEQAHNLLNRVRMKRRRDQAEHRPLIFIAHSLGGIVVKRALVVASQVERYRPIRSSTYGMVFFATPHRGGEFVPLGKIAAKIVRAVHAAPTNSFLESLEKDSLFASSQIDDFRSQLEDYQVLSFFETRPLPHVGIVVDQQSAVLGLSHDRENNVALDLDHTQICKFDPERNREEYELVEDLITEMVDDAIVAHEESRRVGNIPPASASDTPEAVSPDQFPDETMSYDSRMYLPGSSPDPGYTSQSSPRLLMAGSPNPGFSPQASPRMNMPGSPNPAFNPGLGFTPYSSAPTSPDLGAGSAFAAPPERHNSDDTRDVAQSVLSMTLSDTTAADDDDGRRRSSSTLATSPSIDSASTASRVTSRQKASPNIWRSIGMNLSDTSGASFRSAAAAGQLDLVRDLLEKKNLAIDNSGVRDGFTALAEAALHGHEAVVAYLIAKGANPAFNCVSTTKQFGSIYNTPLALAAGKGHLGCMNLLMDAYPYPRIDLEEAMRAAKYRNRADAIRLLQARDGGLE